MFLSDVPLIFKVVVITWSRGLADPSSQSGLALRRGWGAEDSGWSGTLPHVHLQLRQVLSAFAGIEDRRLKESVLSSKAQKVLCALSSPQGKPCEFMKRG